MNYYLTLTLRSDASFGSGDAVPGLVDLEIDHDEAGCPQIGGRALKGLLREEAAQLRYALGPRWGNELAAAARRLFGDSGATGEGEAQLRVGPATLPPDLRVALHAEVRRSNSESVKSPGLTREQVLRSLTTIRRQTAVDVQSGAPEEGSLRAIRVLLRDTPLIATLYLPPAATVETEEPEGATTVGDEEPEGAATVGDEEPEGAATAENKEPEGVADEAETISADLALLAACALCVRRGGSGRNRGRGRMSLLLHKAVPDDYDDEAFTRLCFKRFAVLAAGRQEEG